MSLRLACVLLFLVPSCSSSGSGADPADTGTDSLLCPFASDEPCATQPSYLNDVSPIVDAYCNNCHNAAVDGGPWPLGGYDDVHDWKELMVIDLMGCTIPGIAKGHLMPPADAPSPLPTAQRDVIVDWLLCGAANN